MKRRFVLGMWVFGIAVVTALLEAPSVEAQEQYNYWGASPSISANTPTAYGATLGQVGFGASYQERTRYTNKDDGTAGLVVGLGNPSTALGLDVGVSVLELDPFGKRGSFNVKVHRTLSHGFAAAAGIESMMVWGGTDGGRSIYAVVTKEFSDDSRRYFNALHMSVGVGNDRFTSEADALSPNPGSRAGVFGNIALSVAAPLRVFTEWTGQNLNAGISIVPFRRLPLVITSMAADLLDRTTRGPVSFNNGGPAGDGTRFVVSAGTGFSLF